jgi:hypothetical protein
MTFHVSLGARQPSRRIKNHAPTTRAGTLIKPATLAGKLCDGLEDVTPKA